MKTPMQEMLEWVRATFPMDLDTPMLIEKKVQSLLKKEKEQIIEAHTHAYLIGEDNITKESAYKVGLNYFNETYGGNK